MLRKINGALLSVLSGLLLAIPFNNAKLWVFAWFGFVPVFLALNNRSLKDAFALFLITGITFWSATIYWLAHVTLAGTIVLIFYLSLYFALFGLLIRPFTRRPSLHTLLAIPAFWVLLEYVRGRLMTGFPWAILGYSQYLNLPVVQIADITGAYGVSFLLVSANVAIVEMLWSAGNARPLRAKRIFIFISIFLSLVLCYGYYKIHKLQGREVVKPQVRISVIQGNIPQELKWEPGARFSIIEKYLTLTGQAAKDKADLIIWPEAALPVIPQEEPQLFEQVRSFVKDMNIPLLLGAVTYDRGNYYNSGILISASGRVSGQYNKIHLVPFGEYIPLRRLLPFLETIAPIGDVEAGREYTLFGLDAGMPAGGLKFACLVCFEDVFPELSRSFTKKGAGLLVNITNDGWYKETPAGYQHLQASVFRAVENRLPVVRSANTGVSAFISPSGKITATVSNSRGKEIFIDGYRTGEIAISASRPSFYTRHGGVFIFLCGILAICGIIII